MERFQRMPHDRIRDLALDSVGGTSGEGRPCAGPPPLPGAAIAASQHDHAWNGFGPPRHRRCVPPPLPSVSRPAAVVGGSIGIFELESPPYARQKPFIKPPIAPVLPIPTLPVVDPEETLQQLENDLIPSLARGETRIGSGSRRLEKRTPFIVSLVSHTLLLLLLALMVPNVAIQDRPITISLAVDDPLEEPLFDAVEVEDFEPPADPIADLEPVVEPDAVAAFFDSEPPPPADAAAFEPGPLEPSAEVLAGVDLASLDEALDLPSAGGAAVERVAFRPDPAAMGGLPAGAGSGVGMALGVGNGIGGQIGQRLRSAGAGTGDVQISIAWDNINDIDLHVQVQAPNGRVISYIAFYSRGDAFGGMLDVDRNAGVLVRDPVENVFWPRGMAPRGTYTIGIHHFKQNFGQGPTAVEIVTLVDGKEQRYKAMLNRYERQVVTTFVR